MFIFLQPICAVKGLGPDYKLFKSQDATVFLNAYLAEPQLSNNVLAAENNSTLLFNSFDLHTLTLRCKDGPVQWSSSSI